MSSQQNNVIVKFLYDDDTTRNYTFENVAQADLLNVRSKIAAINANANDEYANFYQTFVSEDGETFVRIESAKIITIEEEEVYSG